MRSSRIGAGFFALVLAGSALLHAPQASAACTSLTNGPLLSPGSQLSLTCQTSNGGSPATGSSQIVNLPTVAGSYTFGNGFGGQTSAIPGSPGIGYGFYDDFVFTIGGAQANSIASTIDLVNLSIADLQVRLYSLSGNSLPTLGAPVGGAIVSWSTPISGPGFSATVAVLPLTTLAPGTYVLEVRGNVTGSGGGSYAGTLNLTPAPVPLPAAAWLLISGLGFVGSLARRATRQAAQDDFTAT
jgi:hypothetical protein